MEILKTFRHEYKDVIPYGDMLELRNKLDKVLTLDRGKPYFVRSIYFDSPDDVDYYDKQGGEMIRKKLRLRIYDIDSDLAKIEIKGKYDYHQLKESLVINKEMAKKIIDEVEIVKLEKNMSYGLKDNKWLYFYTPTPGKENSTHGVEKGDIDGNT